MWVWPAESSRESKDRRSKLTALAVGTCWPPRPHPPWGPVGACLPGPLDVSCPAQLHFLDGLRGPLAVHRALRGLPLSGDTEGTAWPQQPHSFPAYHGHAPSGVAEGLLTPTFHLLCSFLDNHAWWRQGRVLGGRPRAPNLWVQFSVPPSDGPRQQAHCLFPVKT